MTPLAIYIIEVSICLALFYSVYILFQKDTFYKLKRAYLLGTVILSLIIPQLPSAKIPVITEQFSTISPAFELEDISFNDTFEKVVFGTIPESVLNAESKSIVTYILYAIVLIYILGVLYFIIRFIRNLVQIHRIYNNNKKEKYSRYTVINLPSDYPTFSFFNLIFFNHKNLSEEDKNDVLSHEIVHIKQKHSLDIIFIEVLKIILWINPVIWLYKSSIVKVHECLADNFFLRNKPDNINEYKSLLLRQYIGSNNIVLAHTFNFSLIKYRIKMMTLNKSKWWAKFKLALSIPIIIVGLVAFTNADDKVSYSIGNLANEIEKKPTGMVFIPQGSFTMNRMYEQRSIMSTISVDAFWMKESEVSVKEYYEYLESLKKDTTIDAYNAALPDFNKAPYENYFSSKKYRDYPIVGITLPQAKMYCKWKTNTENRILGSQEKQPVHNYRLPMEVEWIYASFGGMNPDDIVKSEVSSLTKTGSKKANDWGLYNMFDNVAEWTANILNPTYRMKVELEDGQRKTIFQKRDTCNIYSNWQTIDLERNQVRLYLDSLRNQTGRTIVKGNSYRNLAEDENQVLEGRNSYDYVGFRYVRSFKGNRN